MTDEEREWAQEQLRRSDVPNNIRSAVTQLLTQWHYSYIKQMKPQERQIALEAFYKLAQNQALVSESDTRRWQPAKRGNIYVRDAVRVRHSAYLGDAGRQHNGREGVVIGIRNGVVFVKYLDGLEPNPEMGTGHAPEALDREVR